MPEHGDPSFDLFRALTCACHQLLIDEFLEALRWGLDALGLDCDDFLGAAASSNRQHGVDHRLDQFTLVGTVRFGEQHHVAPEEITLVIAK